MRGICNQLYNAVEEIEALVVIKKNMSAYKYIPTYMQMHLILIHYAK